MARKPPVKPKGPTIERETADVGSAESSRILEAVIKTVHGMFPGHRIAIMVHEPSTGRFNYATNSTRPAMVALLRALADRIETRLNN